MNSGNGGPQLGHVLSAEDSTKMPDELQPYGLVRPGFTQRVGLIVQVPHHHAVEKCAHLSKLTALGPSRNQV